MQRLPGMDDDAFRKVQAQFATMFADSGAGLVNDEELDPDDAPPPMPPLAALEAATEARASVAAARTGRAEKLVAAASIASTTYDAPPSWQSQSRVPGGTMALSTLGRNQLAGSVTGSLGLAALPQPAPTSTASPSLLVCPIGSDGTLSGSGVPLVPSKIPSSATLTAMAWSDTGAHDYDGLLAAAWGRGTKSDASELTVQVWRISVAPPGATGAPLRAQVACRYVGCEVIKSLAWSGSRLAVCCPSSIRLLEIDGVSKKATDPITLADAALVDLPPSSGNKWSECQFVDKGVDRGGSLLVGMSRNDLSFFICSDDFWSEALVSFDVNSPNRPQPQRLSIDRREMDRLSEPSIAAAAGGGELRALHVLTRAERADPGSVMVQLVVTSDPAVAIAVPAQISVASVSRSSESLSSACSALISEVPAAPPSEVIDATAEGQDEPIDLTGKLGSGAAAAAARLGGGVSAEDGPAIPEFLLLGNAEAEEAAATQSFSALLSKDAAPSANCSSNSGVSSAVRLVTLIASEDVSGRSTTGVTPTIEVGAALTLPQELGAYIPDLLACDETTGSLLIGSSHDESCRLHALDIVRSPPRQQRNDGKLQDHPAFGSEGLMQLTGDTLDIAQTRQPESSHADTMERLKGIQCYELACGLRGLLVLTATRVSTPRESPEAIKEAASKAIVRGGLTSGSSGRTGGLQALALSSAAVAQYSTTFTAFSACAKERLLQPQQSAVPKQPVVVAATTQRQQKSPSPTGSVGLPSSPLSEDGNGDLSLDSIGSYAAASSARRSADSSARLANMAEDPGLPVADWSTAMVAQWLLLPGPRGPGCAEPVAAAAERASFDGAALLELHDLWVGTATAAGVDVSSGRDLAMKILQEEMGLTRIGERLRVFQRLRNAVDHSSKSDVVSWSHVDTSTAFRV